MISRIEDFFFFFFGGGGGGSRGEAVGVGERGRGGRKERRDSCQDLRK